MRRRRNRGWVWLLIAVLALVSLVWVAPLIIVILTAVKTNEQFSTQGFFAMSGSLSQLWTNIEDAAQVGDLWSGFVNSLLYGVGGAALAVLFSALASYALVWLRIRHAFVLFILIYAGTALPFQMYMIPLSASYKATGLYNTQAGMLLFYVVVCIPFCTFVFRSYFLGLSADVLEAARLDGASRSRVFSSIVAPLSINPAILLFLTQFLWIWNDLLFGQVLTVSASARPLMPALAALSGQVSLAGLPAQMGGALLASVPGLMLFVVLRKRFMQGFVLASA